LDTKLDFTGDTGCTSTPNSGSPTLTTPGEWEEREPESAKLIAKKHFPALDPYGRSFLAPQFRRTGVEHLVGIDEAEDCYCRFYE